MDRWRWRFEVLLALVVGVPLFTGLMLAHTSIGWPLVCAGILKASYDVLLLLQFRRVEAQAS